MGKKGGREKGRRAVMSECSVSRLISGWVRSIGSGRGYIVGSNDGATVSKRRRPFVF